MQVHRCQHQRTKKTERTKKGKKRELVFFPTAVGRNWYCITPPRRHTDYAQATIIWDIFIPVLFASRTKSQLNKQAKHTKWYNFADRISFAEHWKLAAESSEFHLTLSSTYRAHFFPIRNMQKKRDILSEKRESGDVDTYEVQTQAPLQTQAHPHITTIRGEPGSPTRDVL